MSSEVLSLWKEAVPASGREAELAALLREHELSRESGKARFVFVRGPAGVGKSHLFGLFRQALVARGVPVFESGLPRESGRPFGLWASMLAQLFEQVGHSAVPALRLAALSRGLGSLLNDAEAEGGVSPPEEQRLALQESLCDLFLLAGRMQPVFLFSDLDAADRGSLELFRSLAEISATPESRASGLFVASFRDEGDGAAALPEVAERVRARSIPLAGLDVEGIRAYLSRSEVAQKLLDATGGNPDALEQLLERPAAKPVELFLRRAARFPEEQQRLLKVLAVAKTALAPSRVSAALERLGEPVPPLAAQLDALVRGHALSVRVVDGTPAYRFAREGEKQAYLEALEDGSRLAALRALGETLLQGDDPVGAASLLLEVDPEGAGAAAALAAADRLSAQGAHEDASELYHRSLPTLGATEKARVLRQLSEIAVAQGDFRLALRQLLRARRAAPQSLAEDSQLAGQVARLLIRQGRLGLATLALQPALRRPETAAAATVHQIEIKLLRGDAAGAAALAEAALGGPVGPPAQWIALRNVLGKAQLVLGEPSRAEALFGENYALAQEHGLAALATMARHNQGVAAHKAGDRERAIAFYQATDSAHRSTHALSLANLGSLYADSGDFEPALDHLARALQAYSRFSGSREVAHVASNLGRLNHFLGDFERAIELSEHALKRATAIGEPYLQGGALLNLAETLLDKGESVEAQVLFDQARVKFEKVGNAGFAALCCAGKARCYLFTGNLAQAGEELARSQVDKGCAQLPAAAIEVELARAEVCLALGDLHGAGRSAGRARDALLTQPDLEGPYRVYFLMAKLRRATGDAAGAQAELARSARLLEELTQRVPAPRRMQFLSVPRRAEVLAAQGPELRLPARSKSLGPVLAATAPGLVGRSAPLIKVTRQLEPLGRSNATVLIRGESGTGKELIAEALHLLSPRKAMPLVKVNCAAMVEDLLLSELFGHEKGAFTGAIRERKGRFELADGGTLFLDEIGDISPKCQVALLRVLQEREFERVGGTRTLKVDVRVICATNCDLETQIAQGRFRQDLYYRLKGVMLELPSLRERLEDLGLLSEHFLARVARERGEAVKHLSLDALELLRRHSWPGNVRELENVLASATIFADGNLITPDAFSHISELASLMAGTVPGMTPAEPGPRPGPEVHAGDLAVNASQRASVPVQPSGELDYYQLAREQGLSLKELRHQVEMQCIRTALQEGGGNISEAARLLKMKRSRLSQIVNSEPSLRGLAHAE